MGSPLNVDEVLDRAKLVAGVQTDADLARLFGKFKTAASNWRSRGTIPLNELVELADTHNVSLDWMLTGRSPKGAAAALGVEEPTQTYVLANESSDFNARLARLKQISEWMQMIEKEEGARAVDVSVIMEIAFKHRLDKEGIRRVYQLAMHNFEGEK